MALGAALAGDMIFFFCLILAFYAKQHASHIQLESEYILDWSPLTVPPILWLNTAALALSGLTMEMARRSVFRDHSRSARV